MSFQDLGGTKAGGHASKSQPKQRRVDEEDSTFERDIRSHIQKMQETVRTSSEQLERMQRGVYSKRGRESIERSLAQSRELAQATEQLFRDWTVHLAGEPGKRHRNRFSQEKLQKAFEDEAAQLKDLARRVAAAEQEMSERAERSLEQPGGLGAREPVEFDALGGEQGSMDEESGLLEGGSAEVFAAQTQLEEVQDDTMMRRIADERAEGIRRIQTQVCEVNQIVRDLASIVTDQGMQLNTIEEQAEVASMATKEATQHLRKASDRHRSVREYFFCLLAAALLVFVFVIMPHLHTASHHEELESSPIVIKQDLGGASMSVNQASQVVGSGPAIAQVVGSGPAIGVKQSVKVLGAQV